MDNTFQSPCHFAYQTTTNQQAYCPYTWPFEGTETTQYNHQGPSWRGCCHSTIDVCCIPKRMRSSSIKQLPSIVTHRNIHSAISVLQLALDATLLLTIRRFLCISTYEYSLYVICKFRKYRVDVFRAFMWIRWFTQQKHLWERFQ